MNTIEVRLEIVVQDPSRLAEHLAALRAQKLIPEQTSLQSAVADAIAAQIPVTTGLEVAFVKGKLL